MTAPDARTPRVPAEANADPNTERACSVAPAGADSKRVATLAAALALRGYEARTLPDGAGWVVGRWGLFKHCATLDELSAFAARVGAST